MYTLLLLGRFGTKRFSFLLSRANPSFTGPSGGQMYSEYGVLWWFGTVCVHVSENVALETPMTQYHAVV
jgi:hypothetical protein